MSRDSEEVLDAKQLSILEGQKDELAQSLHPDAEEEVQVNLSVTEAITQRYVSSTPSHALSAAPEPEELISGALSGPDRASRLPNVILFHWLPPNGPKKGKPHLSLAFRQPHQEQYDYVSFGYVSSNRESMSARNRLQAFWERPGVVWDWLQAFGEEFQLHWRSSKFSKFYSDHFNYCKRWKYECRLYSLDEHVTDIQGLREVRDRLFTMPAYHLIFQNCSTVVLELLAKGGMKDISFHPRQRLYILLFSLFMGHALFHEFRSFYEVDFTQSPKMSVTDALSGLFFHRWIKKLFVNANSIFLSKAKLERSVDETLAPALLTGAFFWVFSYALSKRLGFSPRIFSRENALQHALITPLVSLYSVAIMMRITVPGFWRIEEGSVYNKLHSMLYDLLDWNLDLTEPYATKALLFFLSKPIAIWSIYSKNSKIKEKAIPLLHRIVVSSTFFPFLALFGGWYLIKTTVTPNFVISTLPRSVRLTDEEFRQVRDTDKWQPLPPQAAARENDRASYPLMQRTTYFGIALLLSLIIINKTSCLEKMLALKFKKMDTASQLKVLLENSTSTINLLSNWGHLGNSLSILALSIEKVMKSQSHVIEQEDIFALILASIITYMVGAVAQGDNQELIQAWSFANYLAPFLQERNEPKEQLLPYKQLFRSLFLITQIELGKVEQLEESELQTAPPDLFDSELQKSINQIPESIKSGSFPSPKEGIRHYYPSVNLGCVSMSLTRLIGSELEAVFKGSEQNFLRSPCFFYSLLCQIANILLEHNSPSNAEAKHAMFLLNRCSKYVKLTKNTAFSAYYTQLCQKGFSLLPDEPVSDDKDVNAQPHMIRARL